MVNQMLLLGNGFVMHFDGFVNCLGLDEFIGWTNLLQGTKNGGGRTE